MRLEAMRPMFPIFCIREAPGAPDLHQAVSRPRHTLEEEKILEGGKLQSDSRQLPSPHAYCESLRGP